MRLPGPPARPDTAPAASQTALQRIGWLLTFLRADLAALGPGALLDVRNAVFGVLHEAQMATVTVFDADELRALGPVPPRRADVDSAQVIGSARALLTDLQTTLRSGIETLERDGSWTPFGLTADTGTSPHWHLERHADGTLFRAHAGSWMTISIASAIDLLLEWWSRLRRCAYPPCGVLFLPDEGRQKYHDPKCAALARWHKWSPKRDLQKEKERRVLGNGPRKAKGKKR